MTPKNPERKKLIITGSIIVTLCIIIPLAIYLIALQYSATLDVNIAPSFATLTIDGKTYPINSESHFKPTQTKAIISAEGFQTQEIDLDLKKDETTSLALYLIPDDGDLSWYYNHPEEQEVFQTVGGVQAGHQANSFLAEYPISEILPIQIVNVSGTEPIQYRIDIGKFPECKTDFCLKITDTTGNNYNRAINLIKSKGYDPDDYQIIYQDNSTPFEAPAQAPND